MQDVSGSGLDLCYLARQTGGLEAFQSPCEEAPGLVFAALTRGISVAVDGQMVSLCCSVYAAPSCYCDFFDSCITISGLVISISIFHIHMYPFSIVKHHSMSMALLSVRDDG